MRARLRHHAALSLFLLLWLRFACYRWSRFRRLFERGNLNKSIDLAASLQEIEDLLGQEARERRAIAVVELLKRWDPVTSPVLLPVMLGPAKKSHTVCAFRDGAAGAAYRFFDNARLNPSTYSGYAEVAKEVARRGDTAICWDVADPWSLRQLEFHRA